MILILILVTLFSGWAVSEEGNLDQFSKKGQQQVKSNTGLVLNSGATFIYAVPVVGGKVFEDGIIRLGFGGNQLTQYMQKKLAEAGYLFTNSSVDQAIVRDIKRTFCYVALEYDSELETFASSSTLEKTYELPHGRGSVTVGNVRVVVPEALFDPSVLNVGMAVDGIHAAISKSIKRVKKEFRKDLWANVVVAGNSTRFPGMADRLKKELKKLAPDDTKISVKVFGRSTELGDSKTSVGQSAVNILNGKEITTPPSFGEQRQTNPLEFKNCTRHPNPCSKDEECCSTKCTVYKNKKYCAAVLGKTISKCPRNGKCNTSRSTMKGVCEEPECQSEFCSQVFKNKCSCPNGEIAAGACGAELHDDGYDG